MTTPADVPRTLLVGRGLLGGAVVRELSRRGLPVTVAVVPWDGDAAGALAGVLDRFAGDGPWRVAWCAGAGVTATTADRFAREEAVFSGFADAITRLVRDGRLDPSVGVFFLASSAGALYGGSGEAPFTEDDEPRTIAPYGLSKLALEARVERLVAETGIAAVAGRFTNLYGPGQNLAKPQGLVSHLCRAHVTGAPIGIYVPMDTLRDYLYVDDAASLVCDVSDRAASAGPGLVVKILGSQSSVSVAALLMQAQRVFRRPLRVLHGASSLAAQQSRDLRVRSVVWPELDRRTLRTLPAGIAATAADVEARFAAAR
ncbi:MAG: NAD-dependent epimerase/dehydratase family protein [Actinobacteria bacterium]|nr:NAD-dependent epimerase/dehydratase family protein [Actinomycetota bacterium]